MSAVFQCLPAICNTMLIIVVKLNEQNVINKQLTDSRGVLSNVEVREELYHKGSKHHYAFLSHFLLYRFIKLVKTCVLLFFSKIKHIHSFLSFDHSYKLVFY